MKYCKTCHVHYDTTLERCILCNGDLDQEGLKESTFKFSEMSKRSTSKFFLRFFIFLFLIAPLISIYFDFQDGGDLSWSLIVLIGSLYLISLRKAIFISTIWTSKFIKSNLLSIIAITLIGLSIGSYDWALEYVLPLSIVMNIFMISMLIIFNKKKWFDYFSSLIIIALIGLIPGFFILFNVVDTTLPSLICFAYAFFTLVGIVALPSKSSRDEFKRRFHI